MTPIPLETLRTAVQTHGRNCVAKLSEKPVETFRLTEEYPFDLPWLKEEARDADPLAA